MYVALAVEAAAAAKLMSVENFILHSMKKYLRITGKRKSAQEAARLHIYIYLFEVNA
jgi:hypothetical protein